MKKIVIFGFLAYLLFRGKSKSIFASSSSSSSSSVSSRSNPLFTGVSRVPSTGDKIKKLRPLRDVEKHFRHYRFDNLQALTSLLWDKNGTGKMPTDEDIENRIIGNFIAENSHLYCLQGDLGFYHEYVKYPEPVVIDNISYNFEIARIWYCEVPNF